MATMITTCSRTEINRFHLNGRALCLQKKKQTQNSFTGMLSIAEADSVNIQHERKAFAAFHRNIYAVCTSFSSRGFASIPFCKKKEMESNSCFNLIIRLGHWSHRDRVQYCGVMLRTRRFIATNQWNQLVWTVSKCMGNVQTMKTI